LLSRTDLQFVNGRGSTNEAFAAGFCPRGWVLHSWMGFGTGERVGICEMGAFANQGGFGKPEISTNCGSAAVHIHLPLPWSILERVCMPRVHTPNWVCMYLGRTAGPGLGIARQFLVKFGATQIGSHRNPR
jgi:hypothetical protein